MSRARASNTVSPLSLFPFIGVLLCTMGALLVVLVAVSRQAKDQAQHRVEAAQAAAPAAPENDAKREQLKETHQYIAHVSKLRTDVEQKLRDDQLRLSHLEEHMRRLQDQMIALRQAGEELIAMEGEHYDDRQQATREVERLQQLISDTRQAITAIKAEGNGKKKSYALIPYEGPNGTFRRPIYIECKANTVTIQPEGIELNSNDFQPPLGPGNPLASVLRAARGYLIQRDQGNIHTRDTEPYPLVLVRPDGAMTYAYVQRAIEAGDFDFGFELVEEDWKLKFPAADPHLASIEQQALEHARMRQQLLAEAAPRAYRRPGGGGRGGRGEFDEATDDGFAGGGGGTPGVSVKRSPSRGRGHSEGDATSDDGRFYGGPDGPRDSSASGSGGQMGDGQPGGGQYASGEPGGRGPYGSGNGNGGDGGGDGSGGPLRTPAGDVQAGGPGGGKAAGGVSQPGGGLQTGAVPEGMAGGATGDGGGPVPGGAPYGSTSPGSGTSPGMNMQASGQPGGMPSGTDQIGMDPQGSNRQFGAPPPEAPRYVSPHDRQPMANVRGKDWALLNKGGRAVAVRRTIQVVVRENQFGILSDEADPKTRTKRNKSIAVSGDTIESIDPFVKAVHEQIESWGMAGDGLYWRPTLVLNIGPDGQQRAADLTRLLKDSGLDVRNAATAKLESQGTPSETR